MLLYLFFAIVLKHIRKSITSVAANVIANCIFLVPLFFGTRLSRALADKTADGAASAQQTMEKHKIWLLFCGTAARKFRKGLIRNAFVITVSLTAPD